MSSASLTVLFAVKGLSSIVLTGGVSLLIGVIAIATTVGIQAMFGLGQTTTIEGTSVCVLCERALIVQRVRVSL